MYDTRDLINEMINNPQYSSEDIRMIATIIANDYNAANMVMLMAGTRFFPGVETYVLSAYEDIRKMVCEDKQPSYDDLKRIEHLMSTYSQYNQSQFELIHQYVICGDVHEAFFMANITKDIPYGKLNWIFKSVTDGFDIMTTYIKKLVELSVDQMSEIYAAHQDGVDAFYIEPEYIENTPARDFPSPEIMAITRHALGLGLNLKYNEENEEVTIY